MDVRMSVCKRGSQEMAAAPVDSVNQGGLDLERSELLLQPKRTRRSCVGAETCSPFRGSLIRQEGWCPQITQRPATEGKSGAE